MSWLLRVEVEGFVFGSEIESNGVDVYHASQE